MLSIGAVDLATLDGANGFRLDGIDADDYSGHSVSSAGDVNGDGCDDLIIGAWGADPGGDSNAGETYIIFGNSIGFATSLDLSTLDGANGFRVDGIADNRIVDIEQLDIRGSGANTVTLDVREVLNISSHSNTLLVKRDSGDTVNRDSGWAQQADERIDGDRFEVFTQGAAIAADQYWAEVGNDDEDDLLVGYSAVDLLKMEE